MPQIMQKRKVCERALSPHSPRHLLIGHGGIIFANAPEFGNLRTLDKAEDTILLVFPFNNGWVVATVQQQIPHKLPKVSFWFPS